MEHGLKASQSEIFMIDEVRPDGRVPGLREPPQILIFIDEVKARSERMEFDYDASQGTWRTKGINGVIRPWFFQKVVDQRKGPGRGNVLFQSKQDPMMKANKITKGQKPKYLVHATYWENVGGILRDGIVPAKNPMSELRRPFRDLLRGAEDHVYTSRAPMGTVPNSPELAPSAPSCSSFAPPARPRMGSNVDLNLDDVDESTTQYRLDKDLVGLDRLPDAYFLIDTEKAEKLGIDLHLVQSGDREETIFVQGPVPPGALAGVEPNEPVDLPESLRAKIVDPHSFEQIPIIDLRLDDDTLVEKFKYACEVVGFMQVIGHGISEDLQNRAAEMQRQFFLLPAEAKQRLKLSGASPVRGYFGRGGEDLDSVLTDKVDAAGGKKIARQARSDKKEGFDMNGVPWSKPRGGYIAKIFSQPSRLPTEDEIPGFKEVLEEYSKEMFRISRKMLSSMARVLGQPPDLFEQYLTAPVATHRLLHYWPLEEFTREIGVGEHTDYGLLTVLRQDSVGGLQVLNAKDGNWVHACPLDNAFVVNIGDMLARWTAHRFKSTIHRVVTVSPLERYSVPYFLEPNMDSVIVEGALCGKEAGAEGSVTAEAILERFYRASGQLKEYDDAAANSR
jgi:isopenicillin N synthase-like dioxygenase